MKPTTMTLLPILDDIFSSSEAIASFENFVEIWRAQNFPEHEIYDIRVHVELTKRGE